MLRRGLEHCFYVVSFTLSTVMRCGFFLVTNVLTVSRFGQKRVNVNTCVVNDRIHILTTLHDMRTYHILS